MHVLGLLCWLQRSRPWLVRSKRMQRGGRKRALSGGTASLWIPQQLARKGLRAEQVINQIDGGAWVFVGPSSFPGLNTAAVHCSKIDSSCAHSPSM
jgi:hypothetical protein